MRIHHPPRSITALLAGLVIAGCSPAPAPPRGAPTAPTAPVADAQLTRALDLYRSLEENKSWESAASVGQDIVNRYPGSVAANEVKQTLAGTTAKSGALIAQRRMQRLWSYQSGKESGGNQSTASIYSNDAGAADRVRLILRRHSDWGHSAYLYDSGKGFQCRGTCTLMMRIDDQSPRSIRAYLPPTGEPALFIKDDSAFVTKLEHAQKLSIDAVTRDRGKRTLVFDVGGFDPARFLSLPKK